ncbi:hypothetical protein AAG570_001003 [Ranatra chinensis]|uniref:Growth hormone-inducible transmembrane protein n=1 Tax=Ranatra chinensis TaxID=642074 RepID=A0ABD0YBC8_9HEMI
MLVARLCQVTITPALRSSLLQVNSVSKPSQLRHVIRRNFADDGRQAWTRTSRRRSIKEIAMQPTRGMPFEIGSAAVAGGAVFGLGALCYYGLGMSKKAGIVDQAILWPQYVKDRVKATYMYFGGSILFTAASAVAVFRSPVMLNLMAKNSFLAIAASMAAMIGANAVCRGIPYQPGFGAKQMAWIVHSSVVGAVLAPICLMGGPLLLRAAWLTAGVVGGLSAVAVCAPSDKFLMMGGPLAIGLGAVFASSIGSAFLPPTTMLGAGLYSISIYGGLLLFSGFLLYDTQRIVRAAEVYPEYSLQPFDPVNASISIYLDTINIFIRIATILANGGGNKKR